MKIKQTKKLTKVNDVCEIIHGISAISVENVRNYEKYKITPLQKEKKTIIYKHKQTRNKQIAKKC
jgi:hypothetical protein